MAVHVAEPTLTVTGAPAGGPFKQITAYPELSPPPEPPPPLIPRRFSAVIQSDAIAACAREAYPAVTYGVVQGVLNLVLGG